MSERVTDLPVETLQAAGVKTFSSSARSFIGNFAIQNHAKNRRIARLVHLLVRELARIAPAMMPALELAPAGSIIQPE